MLCLLTRFVFVFSLLASLPAASAAPPEVRLTPPEAYKKIPTRREAERAKAIKLGATTQTDSIQQQRSILENVIKSEAKAAETASKATQTHGPTETDLLDTSRPRGLSDTPQPPDLQTRSLDSVVRQVPMATIPAPGRELLSADVYSSQKATADDHDSDGLSKWNLMDFLPTPRMQKKQNCVAWALGYASYSCQICQERKGEKPVHDHDLFSPAFIYNKLNHKNGTIRDDGLIVTEAIQFILKHGCATAQTMPLFDRSLPNSSAESEADVYRAFGHQRAEDVADIRDYLQQGYPVILVVRNSPEFKKNDKLPKPYHWKKTAAEMANLEPHAVCAVGYDENKVCQDGRKGAVLVMNSYGDGWKDNGFCWVDYETLKTIPAERTDEAEVWCLEAHVVMIKNNNPAVTLSYPTPGSINYRGVYQPGRTTDVSFFLNDDGMVYAGKVRVSPDVSRLPAWSIGDLSCNDETIFVLRKDQMVARLNNDDDVVMARQHSAEWAHLTNGVPVDSKVTMIAAAKKTPLFAITNKGELMRMPHDGNHWQQVRVNGVDGNIFVDLRDNESKGPVSVATNDGRVFTSNDGTGWVLRTN